MQLLLGLALAPAAGAAFSKVAEWDVKEPAALSVAQDLPGWPGVSVLGTTFAPFGKDSVFALGPLKEKAGASVQMVETGFAWPNQFNQVPPAVLSKAGLEGAWGVVADGFLIPGKQTGSITLLDLTKGLESVGPSETRKVSVDKHAWFYHHTEWLDVNGDGLLDIVAARAVEPLAPWEPKGAELVWIPNLGKGHFGNESVLFKGPDVGFRVADLDGDGMEEIVASEFFADPQLAVYACAEKTWEACAKNPSAVTKTVVAGGPGPWFNCDVVDLDADGHPDILATQQQFKDKNGTVTSGRVVAYTRGSANSAWTEHVIADGYLPMGKDGVKIGQGSGSPGTASAVPFGAKRPGILLSGDDGGVVDFFEPTGDWTYTKHNVFTTTTVAGNGVRTIGTVVAADVDASGKPEFIVPAYSENKIYMFTMDEAAEVIV
jgi:hypothetical protein